MAILNSKGSVTFDVQEVSHTSNSAQLTGMNNSYQNCFNWIIDSGATDHMCCESRLFDNMKPLNDKQHVVIILDGRKIRVKHSGDITLNNGIFLKGVFYVPEFNYSLISVHKLSTDLNCSISFNANECFVQEQLKKHLLLGSSTKGLYYLLSKQPFIVHRRIYMELLWFGTA